jgi:hypothetical protein
LTEAVGDFSIGGGRSQGLLRAIIGSGEIAVGDGDKEVLAVAFDDALKLFAGLCGWHDGQQPVEAFFQLVE